MWITLTYPHLYLANIQQFNKLYNLKNLPRLVILTRKFDQPPIFFKFVLYTNPIILTYEF